MKTFTTLKSFYQTLTKNTSSENQSLGTININDSLRTIASIRNGKWKWLETVESVATEANVQAYPVPNKIRKISDIYIQVGSGATAMIYPVIVIYDPFQWKWVLASKLGIADYPRYVYVQNDTMYFSPYPSTSGNTIYIRGRVDVADLTIEDYTTGSIVTATNGDETITGTGTTWTAQFADLYLRITRSTTANTGDGFWYKIASRTSNTVLELEKPYQGTSIVAGTAAYTIGQVSPIPEAYDMAPVYRAVAMYWDIQGETSMAERYWKLYDGGYEAGNADSVGGLLGQMLEESGATVEGPYISPQDIYYRRDPNNPEPLVPGSSFT